MITGSMREGEPAEAAHRAAGQAVSSDRDRHRWRVLGVDAAVLVGLAGIAITQPLLQLLGDNPTFFVAGHYEPSQIIALAWAVGVVPPALVFLATAAPGLVIQRFGRLAHGAGVGLLAALFAVMVCRTVRLDGVMYVAAAALVVGVVVAVAEWRSTHFRRFLSYLAVGNVGFVVVFLAASPTADLLTRSAVAGQEGEVVIPPMDGPVLLVVLDELPVTALMRPDGTINDTRYPNFARLASQSTWFRNAASESRTTFVSTPSILSGRRAGDDDLPILEDHPRNLFTLFGHHYPVNSYEFVTDMCPSDVCEPPPAESFGTLLDDVTLVYQHRVLPPQLSAGLPTIEAGWGNFDTPMGRVEELSDEERRRSCSGPFGCGGDPPPLRGQVEAFRKQVSFIDAEPSVNFVHVVVPHHPYLLTPWGTSELPRTWWPDGVGRGSSALPPVDDPAYEFVFRQIYPLQAMQIGAVDRAIGDAIDHLQATGAWDDALVVVMSDHGIDTTSPRFTRDEDATNTDELFRIPLFIKLPGQVTGEVSDDPASTVDVLPSILDVLDIETDWEFEGHSLFDGSEPSIDHHVTTGVDAAIAVAAHHAAQYPRGDDWADLAAVGEAEDLVGDDVDDHAVGAPSRLRWVAEHEDLLADLSVADGPVPYLLRGMVSGSDARPPDLVVSINGTIAGTVGAFYLEGDDWVVSGIMAPYFVDGRNEVVAYEVDRAGGTVTLHPLVT